MTMPDLFTADTDSLRLEVHLDLISIPINYTKRKDSMKLPMLIEAQTLEEAPLTVRGMFFINAKHVFLVQLDIIKSCMVKF